MDESLKNQSAASPQVAAAYLTTAVLWGTTFYAMRLCMDHGYPAFFSAAMRFSIPLAIQAAVWCICGRSTSVPIKAAAEILMAGVFFGIAIGLWFVAEKQISGGLAAVMLALCPLSSMFLAILTGTEKSSPSAAAGSIVALIGIGVVFQDRLHVVPEQAGALALMLLVPVFMPVSTLVMKRSQVPRIPSDALFFLGTAGFLWLWTLVNGPLNLPSPPPLVPTLALAYIGLAAYISFGTFFFLMQRVRLSTSMTIWFVSPMIAQIVDALFERHGNLTMVTYVGMAAILIGTAFTVISKRHEERHKQ